jgi:hypothetical protein
LPRNPAARREVLEILLGADSVVELRGAALREAVFEVRKRFSPFYIVKVNWVDKRYFLVDSTRDREARENISRILMSELLEHITYNEYITPATLEAALHVLMAHHLPVPEPMHTLIKRALGFIEPPRVEDLTPPPI